MISSKIEFVSTHCKKYSPRLDLIKFLFKVCKVNLAFGDEICDNIQGFNSRFDKNTDPCYFQFGDLKWPCMLDVMIYALRR